MSVDIDLSRAVAATVRPKPRDKNCFLNAYRARFSELLANTGSYYVEGFADGLPHGWVETEEGRIVEVTPTWLAQAPAVEYMGIRRFTPAELSGIDRTLPVTDLDRIRVAAAGLPLGDGILERHWRERLAVAGELEREG